MANFEVLISSKVAAEWQSSSNSEPSCKPEISMADNHSVALTSKTQRVATTCVSHTSILELVQGGVPA